MLDKLDLFVQQSYLSLVPTVQLVVLALSGDQLRSQFFIFGGMEFPLSRVPLPHFVDILHVLLSTEGRSRLQLFIPLFRQIEFFVE